MKFCVVLLGALALAFSVDAGASMHNPNYCYATDTVRPMINMAAVLSSYEPTRRVNFNTVSPYTSTCTPTRFWYLGKYGARIPEAPRTQTMINFAESSVISDIVRNYEAGRTTLCRQDFENIRNFSLASTHHMFGIANAGLPTESGLYALQNISRRFQQLFPDILPETYSPARFHFRHTGSGPSNMSIRAFATGLFGENGAANVVYEPIPEVDWFLRPFDFCRAYNEETRNDTIQQDAFIQGPEVQEVLQQVNAKLGFDGANQLDFEMVWVMWRWCRFEIIATFEESNSETGPDSPWCAPFSMNHHLVLEYVEDLFYYWMIGYGVRNQRLIENMNCGVLQDLLRHMQSQNDTDAMARIFLTHWELNQSILVALGAFRDVWPPHQHNFAQQTGRNWLTSIISPFSTNLAVVRYDCEESDDPDLIFLQNERTLLVPGCDQQTGVCKLSFILRRFQRFVDANCSTFFCSSD